MFRGCKNARFWSKTQIRHKIENWTSWNLLSEFFWEFSILILKLQNLDLLTNDYKIPNIEVKLNPEYMVQSHEIGSEKFYVP